MREKVLHSNDDEMKRFIRSIDFGEQLLRALEKEAASDGRTLGGYVKFLLETHPKRPKPKVKK